MRDAIEPFNCHLANFDIRETPTTINIVNGACTLFKCPMFKRVVQ